MHSDRVMGPVGVTPFRVTWPPNLKKWILFPKHLANAERGNPMTAESRDGGLGRFGRSSNQQAAGSLRIEEEVAVFLPNAFGETHAIANKIAVILQAAGEKSFARGFNRARKITDSRMINFEGHWLDIPLRVAKRHLPSVT